jgi:hypothetical protein
LLRRKKIAIISVLLAYAIIVPVFAVYLYQTQPKYVTNGVTFQTPTLVLGLYWNQECTIPATSIDFGSMIQPHYETVLRSNPIYLKNEGDVPILIWWNSTLGSVTSEIPEDWDLELFWDRTQLGSGIRELSAGQVLATWYMIKIPPYVTIGTYNWTLTIWGTY